MPTAAGPVCWLWAEAGLVLSFGQAPAQLWGVTEGRGARSGGGSPGPGLAAGTSPTAPAGEQGRPGAAQGPSGKLVVMRQV